jgi:hypothetical protein
MRAAAILTMLAVVALSGCISGTKPVDSYTSPTTGKTTVIESDKEMCTRSCNDDYSRCMDTSPAQQDLPGVPNATPGVESGTFGASADCSRELRECLPRCKSQ